MNICAKIFNMGKFYIPENIHIKNRLTHRKIYAYKYTIKYSYIIFIIYLTKYSLYVYTRNLPLDKLYIHLFLYVIKMLHIKYICIFYGICFICLLCEQRLEKAEGFNIFR